MMRRLQGLFFLCVASASAGISNAWAQPIRLIEDHRWVDNDLAGRAGPAPWYEMDAPLAPFGSDYYVALAESTRKTTDYGGLTDFTLNRSASQASVIEPLPDDSLRVAARLSAETSSTDRTQRVTDPRSAAGARLRLTFESDVPLRYEFRYDATAGGDEAPGGWIDFDGFGGFAYGFLTSFDYEQRFNPRAEPLDDYAFTIATPPGSDLAEVQAVMSRGWLGTGTLPAGTFTINASAIADHDGDDEFGRAEAVFELVLTPVPEPAIMGLLLPALAMLRRGHQ